jgi:hypothetical protein
MSMANSLERGCHSRPPASGACALPLTAHAIGRGKYFLKRPAGRSPGCSPGEARLASRRAWFSGSIRSFFRDQLGDGRRLAGVGIERKAVQGLHDLFEQTGRRDYCDRLWALVVLDRSLQRLFGPSA